MGVLDDLAAENAEFVSLRRLLETIRTSEGCSLQQAADWLSRKINRTGESENLTWCKLEPGFGIVGVNNQHSDFAWLGLQRVVNDGAFADGWALADGADHYELLGFRASEIYPILEQCGVRLSGTATVGPAVKPAPIVPDWMRALIPRNQITLGEAAAMLAGFAPMGSEPWSDDELSEIAPWRKALIDAIDHADIVGGSWRSDRDEQPLSHADIRAWCSKWGHTWPIPEPTPLPSTESAATAEIVRLRETVDCLEKNIAERDQKIINVKGLSNARIALLEADLASKKRDIERLESESGQRLPVRQDGQVRGADASVSIERIAESEAKLAEVQREVERLEKLVPPQPVWLMEIAITVQGRYWGGNWQPDDRDTWASQSDILAWLKTNYPSLSDAQRKAIEAVACPVDRNPSSKR